MSDEKYYTIIHTILKMHYYGISLNDRCCITDGAYSATCIEDLQKVRFVLSETYNKKFMYWYTVLIEEQYNKFKDFECFEEIDDGLAYSKDMLNYIQLYGIL